jgi:cyclopropane fatty-acyl-phospholipid synthase-like methyltransferase
LSALNLYAQIEEDLGFDEEISKLYDAYVLLIEQIEPKSIIDIGCGQGKFLYEIQKHISNTFGIDLSEEQIRISQVKKLNTQCINICEVTNTYEIATAIFDVLNYLSVEKLEEFCSCTYNILEENGYFIFDVNTLFGFEDVAQGTLSINNSNKFINIDATYSDNELLTKITVFNKQDNNTYAKEEETIIQYFHEKYFLEEVLIKIGFKIKNVINFKLHDFDEADKYIFICQK